MRKLLALAFVLLSAPGFAADCPIKFGDDDYLDKVGAAIKATKSCDDGAVMAESCALGASGDNAIAPVAERKCGLDFWKKLTAADKQAYNALQAKCDAKYGQMEGTMYISANAFCRLKVARLYSELYSAAE
jgi:hypothetical protein